MYSSILSILFSCNLKKHLYVQKFLKNVIFFILYTHFLNTLYYIIHFILYFIKNGIFLGQYLTTNLVVVNVKVLLNIFLLNVNFDKFTIKLHFLPMSFMFAKFSKVKNQ